jgi:hypothetical protein
VINILDKKKRKLDPPPTNVEERLNARTVSRGLAIGKIVCLHGRKRQFYRIEIAARKSNQNSNAFAPPRGSPSVS